MHRSQIFLVVLIVSLLFCYVSTAGAYTFTVDTTIDSHDFSTTDGICSDKADLSTPPGNCSLRAAIEQINASGGTTNTIILPAGFHRLIINEALVITRDMTIEGAGASTTFLYPQGVTMSTLTLQADVALKKMKIYAGNPFGIVVSGDTHYVTVEDSIITDNLIGVKVDGASEIELVRTDIIDNDQQGIVLLHGQGTVSLTDCTVSGHTYSGGCSGVNLQYGELYAGDTTFTNNHSGTASGGAICNYKGEVHLWGCTVSDNSAASGAGIYQTNGTLEISRGSQISGNASTANGGGLFVVTESSSDEAFVTINNGSEISLNTAMRTGGGIYFIGNGYLDLRNSVVSGNTAGQAGGINYYGEGETGHLWILDSAVINNETNGTGAAGANGNGGGLSIGGTLEASAILINTTISGNSATRHGGGIILTTTSTQFDNVTVTDNTCDSDGINEGAGGGSGGGFYTFASDLATYGPLTLKNSIIAGNHDDTPLPAIKVDDVSGTIISEKYNLIGARNVAYCTITGDTTGNLVGTPSAIIDPGLEPLTQYITNSETHYDSWYHPLQANSRAANAGNPAGCFSGLLAIENDQLGYARVQAGRCDMGAYESAIESTFLANVLISLQVLAGLTPDGVSSVQQGDADPKIGLPEAIHNLKQASLE